MLTHQHTIRPAAGHGQFHVPRLVSPGYGRIRCLGGAGCGARAVWDFREGAGGEFGVEDAVDEALLELGEQAVGSEQVAGLSVVFEQLVEERVGDGWFR